MTDLYKIIRSITGIVLFIAFTTICLLIRSNVNYDKVENIVFLCLVFLSFVYFIIGLLQIRSIVNSKTNRLYVVATWIIGSLPFMIMLVLRLIFIDAHWERKRGHLAYYQVYNLALVPEQKIKNHTYLLLTAIRCLLKVHLNIASDRRRIGVKPNLLTGCPRYKAWINVAA